MTEETKKPWTIKIERDSEDENEQWIIRYNDLIYAKHHKSFFYGAPIGMIRETIEEMLNDANEIALMENKE